MFDQKTRYLQIAFNYDVGLVRRILPDIVRSVLSSSKTLRLRSGQGSGQALPQGSERILIEAGTPFIKREGMAGVKAIRSIWRGHVVADLKTVDGALGEVDMVRAAGATAATVVGNSPTETLDLFIARCAELGMASMIDMLGVDDP
jgi:hypothetical protein